MLFRSPYADAVPGVPTDDEIRAGCLPWYHPSGTCALGTVVDPAGRLDGVAGLRVFDASIIPRIPRANTNATCLAIGERAAEVVAAG